MSEYNITYQNRYQFLPWCQYWLNQGCELRHTSWKSHYPGIILVEPNTMELTVEHSPNKYMNMNSEYHVVDTTGYHLFFNRKLLKAGDWYAKNRNNVEDLFE